MEVFFHLGKINNWFNIVDMWKSLFFFIYNLSNIILFVSVVISFFCLKKSNKNYILIFIYQLILGLMILESSILSVCKYAFYDNFFHISKLLFCIAHNFLLCSFIIFEIERIHKSVFIRVFFYSQLIFMIPILLLDVHNGTSYYLVTASNLGTLFFCVYYLMLFISEDNNATNSGHVFKYFFYGVFICTILSTPTLLFGNYFRTNFKGDIYYMATIMAPFSYLIMYIFFIKAFICLKKIQTY